MAQTVIDDTNIWFVKCYPCVYVNINVNVNVNVYV